MSDAAYAPEYEEDAGAPAAPEAKPAPKPAPEPSPSLDYMTGIPSRGDLEAVTAKRAANLRDKTAAVSGLTNRMQVRDEENRGLMVDAFKATGIQPGELRPWDANAAQERYKTDPLESFGSLGSVFAMVASAFTKAPMTNALNAGAAAMNAIKDGKDQEYERAFKAFKENTDLALKRHNIEQQRYQDADKLRTSDLGAWRQQASAIAAQFEDQQMQAFLDASMDKEAMEYVASKVKVAKDLEALQETNWDHEVKRQSYSQMVSKIDEEFQDPAQRAARKLAAMRFVFDKKEPKAEDAAFANWYLGEGYLLPPDAAIAKRAELSKKFGTHTLDDKIVETANALEAKKIAEGKDPADAKREALQEAVQAGSKMGVNRSSAANDRETLAKEKISTLEESLGEPLSPGEKTAIMQAYGSKATTAAAATFRIEAAYENIVERANAGETITAAKRLEELNKTAAAKSTLPADVLDVGARLMITGNPAWMVGLGRGNQGTADKAAMMERATHILINEEGKTPEEAQQFINRNLGQMTALKRGASNLGQRMSTVYGATNLALAAIPRVLDASEKISRTQFPDLNEIILKAQQKTGGTEVINLGIATFTLATEYARAIIGNGTLTDSGRHEAIGMLQNAYSKGQMRTAVTQMQKELEAAKGGAKKALDEWGQGSAIFGGATVPPPATVPGAVGPDGWIDLGNGSKGRVRQ